MSHCPATHTPAKESRLLLLGAALLLVAASLYPGGAGAASLAEQMAKAMVKMMDTLGDRDRREQGSSPDYPGGSQNWGGMAPPGMGSAPWGGMSPWGGAPWGNTWNPWSMPGGLSMPQTPGGMTPPAWPGAAGGAGAPPLDGAWISNTGAGMIIRGARLQLFSETERMREMTLRYDGNHVWLYDEDLGTAKRYEFAHAEDRMALRDNQGSVVLFRRWQPSRGSERQ
jgi:hypothetical protein